MRAPARITITPGEETRMRNPWKRWSALVPLAAITIAVFAFAACGDDDDDTGKTNDSGASGGSSQPGASGGNASPGGGPATPGGSGGQLTGSGADSLRKLAKETKNKTYKAVYDVKLVNSEQKLNIEGTLTVASKPPKQSYLGIDVMDETKQRQEIVFIQDGDDSYFCTGGGLGALGGGEKVCARQKGSSGGIGADALGGFSIAELIDGVASESDVKVTETRGQKVAGRDTKCWTVKSKESDGIVCADEGAGVILLAEGKFEGGQTNMKAKSVSTSVSDNDFKPPYKVVDAGR